MPRFYVDCPLAPHCELSLPEAAARHAQVLRLQAGDALTLFDGSGGEYPAQVLEMGKRQVRVGLGAHDATTRESPLQLTLVQALSAADRMDYTVQKATELGVTAIHIVQSAFCSYKLNAERLDKRMAHWQAVAISAAEQCGRTKIPSLVAPVKYEEALTSLPIADVRLLLSPIEGRSWQTLPEQATSAMALIGPEGGFSTEEESWAREAGFMPLLLGPRIFRTETVAPVIAALLQARYGGF